MMDSWMQNALYVICRKKRNLIDYTDHPNLIERRKDPEKDA